MTTRISIIMILIGLLFIALTLNLSSCKNNSPAYEAKEHTTSPEAAMLLSLAQQAVDNNDNLTALSYTDSALTLDPKNPNIYFLRGIIQEDLYHTNSAMDSYSKAYQLDPNIPGVKYYLANAYFKYQKFDSALVLYKKALRDHNSQNSVFPEVKAHINVGVTYSRIGHSDSAIHHFQKAMNINPDYSEAYYVIAKEYRDLGETEKALDYIKTAISKNSDNSDYQFEAGNLQYQLGNYHAAHKHFEKVISQSPWNYRATYLLGQCLLRLGKSKEALQQLAYADTLKDQLAQIVVLEDKARQEKNDILSWSDLGKAYLDLGDYQRSEDALLRALSLSPENVVLLNNLAHLNLLQDQPQEAIAYFKHILKIDPHLADVWTNLGIVYAQLGDYSQAEFAWRNALKERPEHPVARSYLERLIQNG
ncbi:MAG: tetratricopeptide repeat protein [Candidatus Marinimicrobia bacterium]|nr:tetratricopeptide repeat protein [Candidatus Neomarinimicrobiota bacterium]